MTLNEIFRYWDTIPQMAADVGESHWTVSKWRQRKSIPYPYWSAVVRAAQAKGKNLSVEDLASLHSRRPAVA